MRNRYIESFEKAQVEGKNIPQFRAGDTLKVAVMIKEGDKQRVQISNRENYKSFR